MGVASGEGIFMVHYVTHYTVDGDCKEHGGVKRRNNEAKWNEEETRFAPRTSNFEIVPARDDV
jgi:hypothetical protein